MKRIVYELWLVDNGSLRDFARGCNPQRTATANMLLGEFYTIEEAKGRLRELADVNFRRDGGDYDRIWDECADAHPEQADEGFSETEIACEKYCNECADAFGFEWNDDLKWVRVREMIEDDDGNREFVKVL